jgi:hypothetical protein
VACEISAEVSGDASIINRNPMMKGVALDMPNLLLEDN